MAASKKNKKKPWKMCASSGHITNIKQSILETFNIYGCSILQQRTKICGKKKMMTS
jgi:hypothetical protein